MLIAAVPTHEWNALYARCKRSHPPVWASSHVFLQAQLGWAIDLVSIRHHEHELLGMLFPERWRGHTRDDVLNAVGDGNLDARVLQYEPLLDGEDTVLVHFESTVDGLSSEQQWHNIRSIAKHVFYMCQ
ncbi:MAG: hypothetical protein D6690_12775 [Nitrospirae bacterium]|nr:MAG: hypothetical protein D6690_12775 [Nitrospirota bacterium]